MKSMLSSTFDLENSIRLAWNRVWRPFTKFRVWFRCSLIKQCRRTVHFVTLFSYPTTRILKALNPIASIWKSRLTLSGSTLSKSSPTDDSFLDPNACRLSTRLDLHHAISCLPINPVEVPLSSFLSSLFTSAFPDLPSTPFGLCLSSHSSSIPSTFGPHTSSPFSKSA
jgi:hypothetical protein